MSKDVTCPDPSATADTVADATKEVVHKATEHPIWQQLLTTIPA